MIDSVKLVTYRSLRYDYRPYAQMRNCIATVRCVATHGK